MYIPDGILSEVRGVVTIAILDRILKKLESVFKKGWDTSACCGAPKLYVTPGKTTHLKMMQKLGLAEKEPIRDCACNPRCYPKNAYELTCKAWIWYIRCHLMFHVSMK